MRYEIHGAMCATSVFTDEGFTIGLKKYSYDDVSAVYLFANSTPLTNGVIQIVARGKVEQATFSHKQREIGQEVFRYLQNIVENKRKIEESNTDFSEVFSSATSTYRYCVTHDLGQGFNEAWGIKHFQVIFDNLMDGERIIFPFIGLHNYTGKEHDDNFAYVVTDKRILMGHQDLIGQVFQSVSWQNINDITMSTGAFLGIVTIDTYKETFNVGVNKAHAQNISKKLHEVFDQFKRQSAEPVQPVATSQTDNSIAYLKQLKELLDEGIITQEEFDAKKKQVLGL